VSAASSPWGRRQTFLLAALLAEVALFSAISPEFRSPDVLLDQSRFWVEIGILAPFTMMVIVARGIDLSVASILALTGVSIVRLHAEAGVPIAWAALLGLCLGAVAGALNGALIVAARIPDLVVTLATMAIYRGLAQAVAQSRVYSNLPAGYRWLGEGFLFGVLPAPWAVLVVSWVVAYLLLHHSTIGRFIFAVGASPRAARLAGVPAARTRVVLYALSGLSAALAAILYTARSNAARSDDATGFELAAIACAVLGGASVSGGRGSAPGLFLAVLAIGVLRSGLILTGVPELYQHMATDAILIAMAALNER